VKAFDSCGLLGTGRHIVRAVLLPATMKLLGDWNWYLPRWLTWLPTLEHGESVTPPVPALAAAD
jgi:uncharacterized membrane protein YdfJ with MMPL/SSD domain